MKVELDMERWGSLEGCSAVCSQELKFRQGCSARRVRVAQQAEVWQTMSGGGGGAADVMGCPAAAPGCLVSSTRALR
jgi:hypothetical protein